MSKVSVLNVKGEKTSDVTLNKDVWAIEPNDAVLYDAIFLSQASLRQGTASTKTRSDVSGGGAKPWRQKGTGRARQGSRVAPHWTGGGIVFGPHPRTYKTKMNKKERRLALKSALSYKVLNSELIVVDNFAIESNKTKEVKNILNTLGATKNVLIVVAALSDTFILATRNLNHVILLAASEINTLDVVSADKLIITESALKNIEEALK